MDAAKLKAALDRVEPGVAWHRFSREFHGNRVRTVNGDDLVTLYEAAESQLKAMTGEG